MWAALVVLVPFFLGAQLCPEPGVDLLQPVLPSVVVGAVSTTGRCFLVVKAIQERNFSQFCLVADVNVGFRETKIS